MSSKAVLLLTFNRPDSVQIMLKRLLDFGVQNVYISLDGPRKGNTLDVQRINETIELISLFRSKMSIKINRFESNLGCAKAVTGGINWFFSEEDEGIILEDDCLPDKTFLPFCWELLEKYRDVEAIKHICGSSFVFETRLDLEDSFFFSQYANIWGWATWKKEWERFDLNLSGFSYLDIITSSVNCYVKFNLFKNLLFKKGNAWSFQWVFTVYESNGLAITPFSNLVKNTGYDSSSTNTLQKPDWFKRMRYGAIEFPLRIPYSLEASIDIDNELTNSVHRFSYFKFLISFLPFSIKRRIKELFM
jgi:hypothetical protein